MAFKPGPTGASSGRGSAVREAIGVAGLFAALLFGGMAIGLAIALTSGGGSVGAIVVGFLALPFAFGSAMVAWRAVLTAWVVAHLGRAALRSRGDERRFREALTAARTTAREGGDGDRPILPGTWVFLPTTVIVGLAAAIAMAVLAEGDRLTSAGLLLATSTGLGLVMRKLARAGRLPIPEE